MVLPGVENSAIFVGEFHFIGLEALGLFVFSVDEGEGEEACSAGEGVSFFFLGKIFVEDREGEMVVFRV